jgi:hypothetical protein
MGGTQAQGSRTDKDEQSRGIAATRWHCISAPIHVEIYRILAFALDFSTVRHISHNRRLVNRSA